MNLASSYKSKKEKQQRSYELCQPSTTNSESFFVNNFKTLKLKEFTCSKNEDENKKIKIFTTNENFPNQTENDSSLSLVHNNKKFSIPTTNINSRKTKIFEKQKPRLTTRNSKPSILTKKLACKKIYKEDDVLHKNQHLNSESKENQIKDAEISFDKKFQEKKTNNEVKQNNLKNWARSNLKNFSLNPPGSEKNFYLSDSKIIDKSAIPAKSINKEYFNEIKKNKKHSYSIDCEKKNKIKNSLNEEINFDYTKKEIINDNVKLNNFRKKSFNDSHKIINFSTAKQINNDKYLFLRKKSENDHSSEKSYENKKNKIRPINNYQTQREEASYLKKNSNTNNHSYANFNSPESNKTSTNENSSKNIILINDNNLEGFYSSCNNDNDYDEEQKKSLSPLKNLPKETNESSLFQKDFLGNSYQSKIKDIKNKPNANKNCYDNICCSKPKRHENGHYINYTENLHDINENVLIMNSLLDNTHNYFGNIKFDEKYNKNNNQCNFLNFQDKDQKCGKADSLYSNYITSIKSSNSHMNKNNNVNIYNNNSYNNQNLVNTKNICIYNTTNNNHFSNKNFAEISQKINELILNEIEIKIASIGRIDENLFILIEKNFIQFLKTHNGSRIFQKYISNSSKNVIKRIYLTIQNNLYELITDFYANYFIQKFFLRLEDETRNDFLMMVKN